MTKQQYVYSTLRDAIIRCELAPGERLVIDELARRFDVSIIPVREALRLLESEGLIVSVAHAGTTVAPISRHSIVEVFALLEGLETVSARAAARAAAGGEDLAELDALVDAMDAALASQSAGAWAELNTAFHLAISSAVGHADGRADAAARARSLGPRAPATSSRACCTAAPSAPSASTTTCSRSFRAGDADAVEQLARSTTGARSPPTPPTWRPRRAGGRLHVAGAVERT